MKHSSLEKILDIPTRAGLECNICYKYDQLEFCYLPEGQALLRINGMQSTGAASAVKASLGLLLSQQPATFRGDDGTIVTLLPGNQGVESIVILSKEEHRSLDATIPSSIIAELVSSDPDVNRFLDCGGRIILKFTDGNTIELTNQGCHFLLSLPKSSYHGLLAIMKAMTQIIGALL